MNEEQKSIEEYVKKYGFDLASYSPNFETLSFIDKAGLIITVSNISTAASMKIEYIIPGAFFILSTGIFSYPHPKFEKVFLNPMREKIKLLEGGGNG